MLKESTQTILIQLELVLVPSISFTIKNNIEHFVVLRDKIKVTIMISTKQVDNFECYQNVTYFSTS